MAEVLDIGVCPEVSLAELLRSDEPVVRAVLERGGQVDPVRPMLWPCPSNDIVSAHEWSGSAPDVELFAVRDARVGGGGAHAEKDGALVFAEGVYPSYVRHYIETGLNAEHWRIEAEPVRHVDTAFVINHFNLIYGHWLTEILPKLFTIRRLAKLGVRAPILFGLNTPAYMLNIAAALLPQHEQLVFDPQRERVAVSRLLLPSMLQRNYWFHPILSAELDALAARQPKQRRPERALFVSRTGMPESYRRLGNVAAVERTARKLGLAIIQPEQMPWFDQVRTFADARLIAGEFGSGMHNAIFSPAGAKVVALNWIVEVQSRIANHRRQDVGYILPTDGRPRRHSPDGEDAEPVFEIDPDEFAGRMEPLLAELARSRRGLRERLLGW